MNSRFPMPVCHFVGRVRFLTLPLESGHLLVSCPGSMQYRQSLVRCTRFDLTAVSVREVELDSAGKRCKYSCQQGIRMVYNKRVIDK